MSDVTSGLYFRQSGNVVTCAYHAPRSRLGFPLPKRQAVTEFTRASQGRARRYLRSCDAKYVVLLVPTYPDDADYLDTERHRHEFIRRLRRRYEPSNADWSAFCIREYGKNGRPHYNILHTDFVDAQWASQQWAEIIRTQDPNSPLMGVEVQRIRHGGALSDYVLKRYVTKGGEQKNIPDAFRGRKTGRWWSVSGLESTTQERVFVPDAALDDYKVRQAIERIKNVARISLEAKRCIEYETAACAVWVCRDLEVQAALIDALRHLRGAVAWWARYDAVTDTTEEKRWPEKNH